MKCIIYSPEKQWKPLLHYFPTEHPYLIKILNKPLLEYFIDFCVLLGVKQIRFVNNVPSQKCEKYFGNGQKWGISISYSLAKPDDDIQSVISKNRRFCIKDDLLILNGFFFLEYNVKQKDSEIKEFLSDMGGMGSKDGNLLFFKQDSADFKKWQNKVYSEDFLSEQRSDSSSQMLQLTPLRTIKQYYELSMKIVKNHTQNYIIPGYSAEEGIYLGRNVMYNPRNCIIKKPIVIGDFTQLKEGTMVGENAIVGDNCLIDSSTTVKNSIIYEKSYLGNDLEIKDKVVVQNKLIEPFSGEEVEVVEDYLISKLRDKILFTTFRKIFHKLIAGGLIIIFALPYLLIKAISVLFGVKVNYEPFYTDRTGKVNKFPLWAFKNKKLLKILIRTFTLDKFLLYFSVLSGKIALVGNQLVSNKAKNIPWFNQLPDYSPGVFNYSDMLPEQQEEFEIKMNEFYYSNNVSLKLDCKIVFKTICNRFFKK